MTDSFDIRNSAFDISLIHHLSPHGMAGRCKGRVQKSELRSFRVFNSTFEIHHSQFAPSSNQSGDCNARSAGREWATDSQGLGSQRDIRRALIEADWEISSDEMRTTNRVFPTSTFEIQHSSFASLPGQLFYSTQIPVCLWFLAKNKNDGKRRDRRKQTLFIDARKLGTLIDPVHRELTDADLEKITSTYHAWRGDKGAGKYEDIAGFCKSSTTAEIAAHRHVLTPGRYVGAEEVEDEGDPFEEKMPRLVAELHAQFAQFAQFANFHDKLPTPCIVIATQRLAA